MESSKYETKSDNGYGKSSILKSQPKPVNDAKSVNDLNFIKFLAENKNNKSNTKPHDTTSSSLRSGDFKQRIEESKGTLSE